VQILTKDNEYHFIEELSAKNNPSVLYFIGKYVKETKHKFTYDEEELNSVDWFTYRDVLKKCNNGLLKTSRKDVLDKAVDIYNLHK